VNAIDPKPGERVLELAAGPGETGLIAAQRLGPEGRLLSTDQAPQMVEIARRRAAELGLENVDFDVTDAQRMELEPESFDAVLCRWGYMLMADPDEALRRTRRVLKRGGRLPLATWDRPDRNLWMSAPVIAPVSEGVMPPPDPGVRHQAPASRPSAQQITGAGRGQRTGEAMRRQAERGIPADRNGLRGGCWGAADRCSGTPSGYR
jgi:SAM-dependent methyltransferase